MIKVLLVDDHEVLLDGLSMMIKNESDLQLVGACSNGELALDFLNENLTDVVVLDLRMPKLDGFETALVIQQKFIDVKVLILTTYSDIESITKVAQANVSGYILKTRAMEDLIKAIKKVCAGEQYFDYEITNTLINNLDKQKEKKQKKQSIFTKRELEIIKLIAKGNTTPQISEKLSISPSTVGSHRKNLIEKTGVSNSMELVKYAYKNNIID
ncbi:response regulator transcription factor [Flavivirga aquimarina]|uniref:Response regulator transcription factor n=1 Tax=Flavivirga aquimarina TaxID=2027862 RepID=A0ABT8WA84_9FLAO|nr:response regulator transcription factor [Flavivirga aquimarina]MDO5970025.1 response regulator transcription factor [Flavivirga aquimarina]